MKLVFASNNANKLNEIRSLSLKLNIDFFSLKDKNIEDELPEPYDTLKENAWSKAAFVFDKYGYDCFSEDTGLIVPSLNGEPGVMSARYAGEPSDSVKNIDKLLHNLSYKNLSRFAYFQTVICLYLNKNTYYFEGVCEGDIAEQKNGTDGFGYDPIFIPKGHNQTFAQMDIERKTALSHRGKAVKQLIDFLGKYEG